MVPIEYIARAVIESEGKFLMCHNKKDDHWFFPGGHIETGESAPEALLREIDEEIGATGNVVRFLGASENKYESKGKVSQEINLVFEVVLNEQEMVSKEDHIEFAWLTPDEIRSATILPPSLRDAILAYATNKAPLWASEGF